MIIVYHLNILNSEFDRRELNKVGWSGHPSFARAADLTAGMPNQKEQAEKAFLEGEYKAVAIVTDEHEENLETAFRLTNHIEKSWVDNAGVVALGGPCQRSTSVGDLMDIDGVLHLVASMGFVELGHQDLMGS